MAEIGPYCKAYTLEKLREFENWTENKENARPENLAPVNEDKKRPRELKPDHIVYLHENHVVTDGIYKNENIIFDNVTPEWIAFCQQHLKFEIPI